MRATVETVAFAGNQAVPKQTLRQHVGCKPARRREWPGAVDRVRFRSLSGSGYESATVDASPSRAGRQHVSDGHSARPSVFCDHVLIVGNGRTKTATIERELQVKRGDPFSLSAINDSQRRLTALGLFRRARITELRHGGETTRDLLVTIEEGPATTVGYGGGVEGKLRVVGPSEGGVVSERFEVAPRAFSDRPPQRLGKNDR